MMREPSENLRRYPRFHVDVQANVRTLDGRKLAARTRDLSRSGICLVTPEDLASGAKLSIELVLLLGPTSSSEPLPLRARVVWCTAIGGAYQIGAMFDGLSSQGVVLPRHVPALSRWDYPARRGGDGCHRGR
jgi:hypothetical protein